MQPRREPTSDPSESHESDPLMSRRRYRRMKVYAVVAASLVAVLPLVIMTVVNYKQYEQAFRTELLRPITQLTSNAKLALEFFLAERRSALSFVLHDTPLDELQDSAELAHLLKHVNRAFGGFVDLGLFNASGDQVSYAGPFQLQGKSYADQLWFHRVVHSRSGVLVSDVFTGYRKLPHFVIALRHQTESGGLWVLRATVDTDTIDAQILPSLGSPSGDVFLVNQEGILQTKSRRYGPALSQCPLPMPPSSHFAKVEEMTDSEGNALLVGHADIDDSPFTVMLVSSATQESWLSLRRELVIFLIGSIALIMIVVVSGASYFANRAREADLRRATIFHKMEYTNKMAAIGRLGAGVAHEINNPLAIIGEKAGLMKDLLSLGPEMPPRDKLLQLTNSVLKSVERCSTITHRLLGFARHIDVKSEKIDLERLMREVLGFLEKEASFRAIEVSVEAEGDVPTIDSDRGQLQQVFLNIINNAFAAVHEGGRVDIRIWQPDAGRVAIAIRDNGSGIPEEMLTQIFEPFFTTKKGTGTGLGLSITYGIVRKLRGNLEVESKVGEGTCFTVTLPVRRGSF